MSPSQRSVWAGLLLFAIGACTLSTTGSGPGGPVAGSAGVGGISNEASWGGQGGTAGDGGTGGIEQGGTAGTSANAGNAGTPEGGSAGDQTGGTAGATAGASGLAGGAGVAGLAGTAGEAGTAGSGGAPCPAVNGSTHRRLLKLSAPTPVPAGYSIRYQFNHVTLPGKQNNGSDLRVVYHSQSTCQELDRVLDLYQESNAWNRIDTAIYFKTVAPLSAGQIDSSYYLYWGGPPGQPMDNPEGAYLFWDGFESNKLDKWDIKVGNPADINITNDAPLEGSSVLRVSEGYDTDRILQAKGISEANIAVDSFWKVKAVSVDLSQGMRVTCDSTNCGQLEVNCDKQQWTVATYDGPQGSGWKPVGTKGSFSLSANEWFIVSTQVLGSTVSLIKPVPVQANPLILPPSGSISLRARDVAGSWWVDAVRARRLVSPEPNLDPGQDEKGSY